MTQHPPGDFPNRRWVLGALMAGAASPALARSSAPKRSIRPQPRPGDKPTISSNAEKAAEIIAAAGLTGKTGFLVADAQTGEVLEAHRHLLAMPPASVTKTVTTLYGLETLGTDFRFKTQVLATGPIVNGRLEGDLYLVGGGDPTLDSDALADMARQLKEAGLREITGRCLVHAEALPYQRAIDPSQPEYLAYNPSLSGLNLNYNRVFFQWKRHKKDVTVTMDARAVRFRPQVTTASMRVVDHSSQIFTLVTGPKTDSWTISRGALSRKGGRWLPVRRPEFYAAEVFQTISRSFGIVLPAFERATTLPASATVIAQWQSRKLDEMLRYMLKFSTNLTAECVGLTATKARGGNPRNLRASAQHMSAWLKQATDARHARFVDHSGLEEGNRISARDMVQVLLKQGWDGHLHRLMKKIKLHDSKGRPLRNSRISVHAKTGTLNFVSALAGYADGPGSRKLAFAIFSADMPRRAAIPKERRARPKGARGWNRRAKKMQQKLIEHWIREYRA